MVRELDISRITLRLMAKEDKKGGDDEHVFAKLTGDTISILQQCLVRKIPPGQVDTANSR